MSSPIQYVSAEQHTADMFEHEQRIKKLEARIAALDKEDKEVCLSADVNPIDAIVAAIKEHGVRSTVCIKALKHVKVSFTDTQLLPIVLALMGKNELGIVLERVADEGNLEDPLCGRFLGLSPGTNACGFIAHALRHMNEDDFVRMARVFDTVFPRKPVSYSHLIMLDLAGHDMVPNDVGRLYRELRRSIDYK